MSVKERLIKFAKTKEKSVRAFEVKTGLTIGYINAIRVSIQPDKVNRIALHFPELNTGWLLTGEGEMIKPAKNPFSQMTEQEIGEASAAVRAEEWIRRYEAGEIFPAEVHHQIVAEKDRLIAEMQRRIWELEQQIKDLTK